MISTALFTLHKADVRLTSNAMAKLIPFGDVHRHAPLCDVARWHDFLEQCRTMDDAQTRYIGMGDYDDLASASEREVFASPKLHESSQKNLDEFAMAKVRALCNELAFMKGRLLGLIEGNHFWRFSDTGITSTQKMCEILGCKYLGVSAVVRMVLRGKKHHNNVAVDLWAHHGKGASRLVGSSFNRVEQMREAFPDCDIYLMGHDHRRGGVPATVLHLSESSGSLTLRHKKQLLCRTGSFLRAYVPGEQSYIVDEAKAPADLGAIRLELTVKRDQSGGGDRQWVDIHCWN